MRFWLFLICYAPQFFLSFPWCNVLIFRPFPTIISFFGPRHLWYRWPDCSIMSHRCPLRCPGLGHPNGLPVPNLGLPDFNFCQKVNGIGVNMVLWNIGSPVDHFSRTDLLYAVRSSTQVFKFLWWLKNKVFNKLSLWGLKDSPWDTSKSGLKVQIR